MNTYSEYRSNIKTGDILVWSHRTSMFASWYDFKIGLIRIFDRTPYTHVGVAWVVGGRVFVLEAVTGGIRPFPLSKALPFYHIPFKPMDEEKALSVCGEPYSEFEAILGKFNLTNPNNGKWQCSEYVKWVHALPCNATPSAIVDYCLDCGCTISLVAE